MAVKETNRWCAASLRLLPNEHGNVLLITAAALIPLIGIIGSGIDIGRAYMTELRLQQACDAGALAGRKAMAAGVVFDGDPKTEAEKMFYFNFPEGMYGTNALSFSPTASGGTDVVAVASVTVPTTLMRMFGYETLDVAVSCGAKLEVSNTDVMLVLDVTGSMNTSSGNSTRIQGLKEAATDFVNILSGADVGEGTIRIGMVPYSNTVNVGELLKSDWIASSVTIPSQTYLKSGESAKYWSCIKDVGGCKNSTQSTANGARYVRQNITYDVSGLKTNGEVANKAGSTGNKATHSKWEGCIVERQTVAFGSTAQQVPAGAYDLDIDHVPDSEETRWKPYLPGLAVERTNALETTSTSRASTILEVAISKQGRTEASTSWQSNVELNMGRCPAPAVKLTNMETGKQDLLDKIDALKPRGMTYHDTGLVWGGRLISPTGLFREENEVGKDGRKISRHIVFMTDGALQTDTGNYSHQGMEAVERRVSGATSTANSSSVQAIHAARFEKICGDIKARGITIWTVNFASTPTAAENRCSSSGSTYRASNNTELGNVFRSIAGQISRLRVSQ